MNEKYYRLKQLYLLKPYSYDLLFKLGNILSHEGRLNQSIKAFRKAISLKDDLWGIHYNLALALLSYGDYENGWIEYRSRIYINPPVNVHFRPKLPCWNGDLSNKEKKLILISEQGLGDTIQFIRYAKVLERIGFDVSVGVIEPLLDIIKASNVVKRVYSLSDLSSFQSGFWSSLMTVPEYLNVSPSNPILVDPYIKSSKDKYDYWSCKLCDEKRPIIGINWSSNASIENSPKHKGRSIPFNIFSSLIKNTTFKFVSLQKSKDKEIFKAYGMKRFFVDAQDEISSSLDFLDTAAIIQKCNLVITSDTCVAHLAGAMGKKTWLLLKNNPDWRWGNFGNESFWYPSLRLFRQSKDSSWEEVIDKVKEELQKEFVS
tara:strand:+ start:429 stop:1547 length:1119 start_codon:yes stop_codon:yes gene_type:complete